MLINVFVCLFVAGSVRFLVVQERYRLLAAKEELQRFVYAHNHLAGIQSDCYIPVSVGWEDIDAGADTGRNGHVDWSEFDPDIYSYNIAEPRWIWEKQLILTVFPLQLWKCKKILRINLGFRTSGNGDAPVSAAITDSEKLTREIDREGMRYLLYLLYPLCILGAAYSLIYQPHKRWVTTTDSRPNFCRYSHTHTSILQYLAGIRGHWIHWWTVCMHLDSSSCCRNCSLITKWNRWLRCRGDRSCTKRSIRLSMIFSHLSSLCRPHIALHASVMTLCSSSIW